MNYADAVVAMLKANSTLVGLLTGGIYNYPEGGRKGINRTSLPAAYENAIGATQGLLKPLAIVYVGDEVPDNQIVSPNTGVKSVYLPTLVWIYDDGSKGYGVISAAHDIVYTLLADQRIEGGFQALYRNTLPFKREQDMQDACYYRARFDIFGLRRRVTA